MDIELTEIRDFLAAHSPFDQLPDTALDSLPQALELRYVRRGSEVFRAGGRNEYLHIVRTGAVDITDADETLLARLGEGDTFGERSLLRGGEVTSNARTIEDTLLYQLPAEVFDRLRREHKRFSYHFEPLDSRRLRDLPEPGAGNEEGAADLLATPIGELLSRTPVCVLAGASIREAARLMSEQRVSSLLVRHDDGSLEGIVTDRDLRSRCVAAGLSADEPVRTIMTAKPMHVTSTALAYEALLAMARHNVHHLPVVDDGRVQGMLTATDLMHRRSSSVVYLVGNVHKQEEVDGLARIGLDLPGLLCALVDAGASAHGIGHMLASVGEAITTRLLVLAERHLGAPPVPYAWLAAGSLARHEQSARCEQDNTVLIADDYRAEAHGEWFQALGRFVCDGLDRCGYGHSAGNVMATNPQWRQPLAGWKKHFDTWLGTPEPMALMHARVFFDMRCLHGDTALFRTLREHVLAMAAGNRPFLARMAGNALQQQPPLGFFRNFVLVKSGEHGETLDLEQGGVVPIVDMVRVHALAAGVEAVNTQERLKLVGDKGELSGDSAADLRDAFEFIGTVRLRHQARQIRAGKQPADFMPPDRLSRFERDQLKNAFGVVRTLQAALAKRHPMDRRG